MAETRDNGHVYDKLLKKKRRRLSASATPVIAECCRGASHWLAEKGVYYIDPQVSAFLPIRKPVKHNVATLATQLPLGYSTSTGERESCLFREEPWHLHLHYVSSLSMHSIHSALPTCQPPFMVRSLQLVEVRPYAKEEELWCTNALMAVL